MKNASRWLRWRKVSRHHMLLFLVQRLKMFKKRIELSAGPQRDRAVSD
jgi:hypothetical protein